MDNIKLKDLLYDIALLENDNLNYNSKKTNKIILSLIKDTNHNFDINMYSPSKKSTREFLKKLGKYKKVDKKDITSKCLICLNNFKLNEYKRELPVCKHFFHKKCIDIWFHKNETKKCPICYHSYKNLLNNCNCNQYIKL